MTGDSSSGPRVRVAGVLIEDGRVLVVKQNVTATRHWALPGGKLESGETIGQCMVREVKEETGLDVALKELLYVTDRLYPDAHIVHMMFLVHRVGENDGQLEWRHEDPHPSGSPDRIREVRMVPVEELGAYGFSLTFARIIQAGFPGKGAYKGDFHTVYGEP